MEMITVLRKRFCGKCLSTILHCPAKYYHNRTAVYGYRPKDSTYFKLNSEIIEFRQRESQLFQLISAYREHGHKCANINPVDFSGKKRTVPELDPLRYGLTEAGSYSFSGLTSSSRINGNLKEALEFLNKVYCGNIGAEFSYLQEEEEREWFATRLEQLILEPVNKDFKRKVALEMLKCQAFDHFMAKKFVSLKRYGAEGAESIVAFFLQFLKSCVQGGVAELIIGMPHRGRLNLLINLFNLPPELLFRKLSGKSEFPDTAKASGDVISHLISNTELDVDGIPIQVTSLHNPSHLEAVNPVSVGKTRCRHLQLGEGEYGVSNWSDKILNLQVHGDGAIAGQGINQETLFLGRIPHFEVGGSVHLIVNNQVAFTTPPERGRGTPYCSDIAKIIAAPVVHVNGNVPEDVVRATQLVTEYQRKFRKDVFLDLNCYRLRGHNELDDPTFTNPKLYEIIKSQRTVPDQYAERLQEAEELNVEEVEHTLANYTAWLNACFHQTDRYSPPESYLKLQWRGFTQAPAAITVWDTGCDVNLLRYIATQSVNFPEHFKVHPTLLKNHVNGRLKRINEGLDIDWSTAEAMAWGSLLYEGYNVRISGQDVGRGTFSHRHAMLVDQETNDLHIPLNNLAEGQATFLEIANSHLSEEAVLGFEYGMSLESPKHLFIWEAQFGDFFNGAQIQIDTFIASGETKWMRCSGLVMLLPHGYDGAGPEHSSCRIERFLQLTDSSETLVDGEDVNMHIANPTTPAQYFHLMRRQMIRNYRKPLVVVAPKTLIRDPEAVSSLIDFGPGARFHPVLGDKSIRVPEVVTKVLLVSGKHFYALRKQRDELGLQDVAIVRIEELCPFPTYYLQQELDKYSKAKYFIWCQEEHRNMGAWTYCKPRFENLLGTKLMYSGRGPLATPAVGIGDLHKQEVEYVKKNPFEIS